MFTNAFYWDHQGQMLANVLNLDNKLGFFSDTFISLVNAKPLRSS